MTVNVYITEYADLAQDSRGLPVPIPLEPALKVTKAAITTSAQTTLQKETRFVEIVADADVYMAWGTNPSATASSTKIPSGLFSWRGISRGAVTKVAFYDGSS